MMTEIECKELEKAKYYLENPGIASQLTSLIGTPIEKGISMLPENWNSKVADVVNKALLKSSEIAIFSMKDPSAKKSSDYLHKVSVAITGGLGGFFGIAALAVELPITTTLMMRSIADIARSEGENLSDLQTKLACIEVFALGGTSVTDDAAEAGYFAVRAALSRTLSGSARQILEKGITEQGSPLLMRFIAKAAERFSIQITEKAAAQAIPIIGAAGGAIINTVFINHFQNMARGHFIVRRLERKYGPEIVAHEYAIT